MIISPISSAFMKEAMTYLDFQHLMESLVSQGQTTGPEQTEHRISYTRLNLQRMHRIGETVKIDTELITAVQAIKDKYVWLILVEAWCGDVAQNIPAIIKAAGFSDQIKTRLILRDQYPEVMDQYLTEGSRSIPKLVCFREDDFSEVFSWGPRPLPVQQLFKKLRTEAVDVNDIYEQLHLWYSKDKTRTLQNELLVLISRHLL